ncbi:hypothetical protein JRO89_XS03G0237200 [Xanthoceras sorbifolium]|uniref:Transcription initiation factor TFIID subunit 10 n=1 Tax=Xanthoceras sorbifolium TaxID=99658 RepID=A0ABQ8IBR3_9ROSI|nr:hypothetical protein JRO89_XS03G0237200 [Xanthoceras sorbifolium]
MNHNNQQSSDGRHDDDATLTDFLASLMDYTPTIPDELVEHYLAKSGFQCPDVRLTRLVAVATQKFVAEVASDALQTVAMQGKAVSSGQGQKRKAAEGALLMLLCLRHPDSFGLYNSFLLEQDKRLILTMEDLSKALREQGVNVKHQEYFADSPSTGMDPASREE